MFVDVTQCTNADITGCALVKRKQGGKHYASLSRESLTVLRDRMWHFSFEATSGTLCPYNRCALIDDVFYDVVVHFMRAGCM